MLLFFKNKILLAKNKLNSWRIILVNNNKFKHKI